MPPPNRKVQVDHQVVAETQALAAFVLGALAGNDDAERKLRLEGARGHAERLLTVAHTEVPDTPGKPDASDQDAPYEARFSD